MKISKQSFPFFFVSCDITKGPATFQSLTSRPFNLPTNKRIQKFLEKNSSYKIMQNSASVTGVFLYVSKPRLLFSVRLILVYVCVCKQCVCVEACTSVKSPAHVRQGPLHTVSIL